MRASPTARARLPLAVGLGAVVFFGLTWRLSFVITDNWTLANTLVAVSDGHLHLTEIVYGPDTGGAPGAHLVDGRVYGRNYGQIVGALPVLWALEGVTAVVPVTVLLPTLWSAALFGFVASVGQIAGQERLGVIVGALGAVALLAINVALVGTVDPRVLPLLALQIGTLVAAALTAVLVLALVRRIHGDRIGLVAGFAVVLATPVGFWATIPKRHAITAFLAVLTLYLFYRSRAAADVGRATRFRALAYVPVGLTTWVHAPEGLVLFLALVAVDLPTAPSNGPRQLALVGIAFGASLLPFFVTNWLIAGNPLVPPRALPAFEGQLASATDAAVGQSAETAAGDGLVGTVLAIATTGLDTISVFGRYLASNAGTALAPGRLVDVFVRSGHGLGFHQYGVQSVNLSVLESMPLVGTLLVTPLLLYRRLRDADGLTIPDLDPVRATDALAVGYLVVLALIYVPRLPLHVTFTVRYLHPLFPLSVYFLARVRIVRRVVHARARWLAGSYVAVVLVGGPVFVAAIAAIAPSVGAGVQLNARLALAGAAVLLYWAVVAVLSDGYERLGAMALAFAGATTTVFLVLSAVVYFRYGAEYALPVVRELADLVVLFSG